MARADSRALMLQRKGVLHMSAYEHIIKYPRTPHLEGSNLQAGDEDLSQVRFSEIAGKRLTVEEKIDGANSGISFDENGKMLLQSRGHFLTGGYRERHYQLMKDWAGVHRQAFYDVLGSRYIMYGEWMYAKHSVFYDALPHYFMEFDIYDRETGRFLDTASRREMTARLPIVSVPVLAERSFEKKEELLKLLGPSLYITSAHTDTLRALAAEQGLDPDKICRETDPSMTMEGLYVKIEEDGEVKRRLKYVRGGFRQCIEESQTHWLNRPIIPNQINVKMEDLFQMKDV